MAKNRQKAFIIDDETQATLAALDAASKEQARWNAGQELLKRIDLAFDRCSRRVLQALTLDLARVVIKDATLEDLRAQVIELEEVIGI